MRPAVREFLLDVVEQAPLLEPIVEIGARPAEGQEVETDVRGMFPGREYIACDLQEGPGLDRIEDIHALTFEDNSVGTLIALDTLEHVADPIRALQEVHRVLKPGGVVAISSVMFFVIHAHPWDFWRFTPEGFSKLLEPFESSYVLGQGWDLMPETVFGVGVKGPAALGPELLPRASARAAAWGQGKNIDLGPMRMTLPELWRFTARQTLGAIRGRRGTR
jgi:SAM-dependent methyltransferase